jgi:hypothetical protein
MIEITGTITSVSAYKSTMWFKPLDKTGFRCKVRDPELWTAVDGMGLPATVVIRGNWPTADSLFIVRSVTPMINCP